MYARLALSAATNPIQCIRDIGRLITSASPSISDLSGQGFSTLTSVIIDNTPAGWTYVGSNKATDQPTIGSGAADANWTIGSTTYLNWAFSAPCLNTSQPLKYAVLTHNLTGAGTSLYFSFALTGAVSATNLGVITSEGFRFHTNSTTTSALTAVRNASMDASAAGTIHLIATPRHITLIQENKGMLAVWEATSTDIHDRLLVAPFIQYSHAQASNAGSSPGAIINTGVSPTLYGSGTLNVAATAFNITDINTNVLVGTRDLSFASTVNYPNLFQHTLNQRANTINSNGSPMYVINPVFFQMPSLGYPTQFVTGVVPIYWTRAGLGASGDTVAVGSDTYYFFNVGASGVATYGVLMKLN